MLLDKVIPANIAKRVYSFCEKMNLHMSIYKGNVSKTAEIKYLAERLGIDKSNIITIGDSYNDIDMLE